MSKQQSPPDELQQLRARIYALGRKKRAEGHISDKDGKEMDRLGAKVAKLLQDKMGAISND